MTISLERALRHMAWANQKVYDAVEFLPEESLKSFVVNEERSEEHTSELQSLRHLVCRPFFIHYETL